MARWARELTKYMMADDYPDQEYYTCYYCGRIIVPYDSREKLVDDTMCLSHVVPRRKGGKTQRSNCVLACHQCCTLRFKLTTEDFATTLMESSLSI